VKGVSHVEHWVDHQAVVQVTCSMKESWLAAPRKTLHLKVAGILVVTKSTEFNFKFELLPVAVRALNTAKFHIIQ
jgi:hypothetical protein